MRALLPPTRTIEYFSSSSARWPDGRVKSGGSSLVRVEAVGVERAFSYEVPHFDRIGGFAEPVERCSRGRYRLQPFVVVFDQAQHQKSVVEQLVERRIARRLGFVRHLLGCVLGLGDPWLGCGLGDGVGGVAQRYAMAFRVLEQGGLADAGCPSPDQLVLDGAVGRQSQQNGAAAGILEAQLSLIALHGLAEQGGAERFQLGGMLREVGEPGIWIGHGPFKTGLCR
jgi:hypothetical protein